MVFVVLFVFCSVLLGLIHNVFLKLRKAPRAAALFLALALALSGSWATAYAGTKSLTTTTLAVTSGGGAATSVASGSVVTLTASVLAGTTKVTTGQVNFCDASATYCTDIYLLGTAQLTSAGTAALKLRPGIGSHSYKAVFAGTNIYGGSASGAGALTVTGVIGPLTTATSIAETGSWGNYTLTGTVSEVGGTATPGGTVSFQDASSGNAVVGTGSLGAGTQGIAWLNSQVALTTSFVGATAVADLNEDGIPDLAIADGSGGIEILLGKGDGTFTTVAAVSPVGSDPIAIAAADFNSDGKPDLAVLNNYSNTVTILLGNGDGTFTATASSPATPQSPSGMAVGDFNGDGIADLALVAGNAFNAGAVTILLGNGDGTFTATSQSTPAGDTPDGIVAGDFNGDGKTDLAVTDQQDTTLTILLGNGDGTFTAAASPQVTSYANAIAAADFDGDGKTDLAVTCTNGGSVIVLLGNGDGTFTAAPAFPVPMGVSPVAVVVADFNGDGIPDVAILDNSYTTGGVKIFLGKGDGAFLQSPTQPAAMSSPAVLAEGDFNGDGRPDVSVANNFVSVSLSLFLTEPTETATASANSSLAGVGQHLVSAIYAGDSNYTSSASGSLPLWGVLPATTTTLALSSGGTPATSVSPGSVVTFIATAAVGSNPVTTGQVNFCDASASSCTDIHLLGSVALTSSGTATFKYVPGPGAHSYNAQFVQNGYGLGSSSAIVPLTVGPAPAPVYSNTTAIAYGGFPGDYSLTATVLGLGGSAPPTGMISFQDTSFGGTSLATATLGSSTAGIGWLISQTPAAGNNLISEVQGDFNGDGMPDLVLLWTNNNSGAAAVTIFLGKGDGTFTAGPTTQSTITSETNFAMITGDFNGDGKTDLALLSYSTLASSDTVTTFLSNGDGTFAISEPSAIFNQGPTGGDFVSGSLVAADFNGDGKLDLAVVGDYINSGGVTIVLGKGDGTFTGAGPNVSLNADFGLVAAGDFNGDGIPDMVATNYFEFGESPTIFLGKGDGTFTATVASFTLDYFPTSIVVGDFNGDRILDLAFSDLNGVEIALGKGDGTFKETLASPIAVPSELYSLVAGDFNHDGKLDLAGVEYNGGAVDLLVGAGDGTFIVESTSPVAVPNSSGPFSIVAGDFNQDGVPDLAMITKSADTASILLTEPTETATATVSGIAPVGAGTHNVEASYSGDANYSASVSETVALTAALAPVVISPASGTYSSVQTVTLSESLPGATIYYYAFGTVNTNGFVPYTAPISLTEGGAETIQAYATETGYQQSDYTTANYYLNLPAAPVPVFSPGAGNYVGVQSVTISDGAPGATIYYTTNGAPPTTYATQYAGPITVSSSVTLAAAAIAPGYSLSAPVSAQYLIGSSPTSLIYAVAGNGSFGYSGDGGPALVADLNAPTASLLDSSGNLYILDSGNNVVRKVAASTGVITTIAGNGTSGYSGDNGPATSAQLNYPTGFVLDGQGNLYIADSGNNVVRKIAAATGVITTVAGNGTGGYTGDNGPAASAELYYPASVSVDSAGNLFIADTSNDVIRKVNVDGGTISTVVGNGQWGYGGDGGPATAAELVQPRGLAFDIAGDLYIADTGNHVIREVNAATGLISTVAGTRAGNVYGGYSGDGGPATSAQLNAPEGVAFDSSGNLYIADTYNQVIREVAATTGIISTVAGGAPACNSLAGDGGPANSAALCYPESVFVDHAGNLYIASPYWGRIRLATAPGAVPTTAAATPAFSIASGTFASPQTVTIADSTPGAAIYVTLDGSTPTTAGQGYNGPINVSGNVTIRAIAVGPGYLASAPVAATYTITSPPPVFIDTVAGDGVLGFSGSGGPAASAQFGTLAGMAVDGAGNLYFADTYNNVIWEFAANQGIASVVAGSGRSGYTGDGGAAISATFNRPNSVAVDGAGNLYIADTYNNVVRKVTASTGLIATFAGNGLGQFGNIGDGGPAIDAELNAPNAIALDKNGNLYVADTGDYRVRMVSASSGLISTVAGNGNNIFSGDGGLATNAGLGQPSALALDNAGNLYIASAYGGRVRKVVLSSGNISTVAGNGNYNGSSGDGGPATAAEIYPQALAADPAGNLYLSDWPAAIRVVSASTGIITRIAGNGYYGYSGDGGSATVASLDFPEGIAFNASGQLYIADSGNYRVRQLSVSAPTATPTISPATGTYTGAQMATITDSSAGAIIYYTTDGTAPTNTSNVYGDPIAISATTTLRAIAIAPGLGQSAVASATFTIQLPVAPTVTITPSATSITTSQSLSVAVTIAGPTGSPVPTGSVTLSSGGYNAKQNLTSGTATFNVAAGTLQVGANTLTAAYAPDSAGGIYYTSGTQTTTVTVAQAIGTAAATLTLTPSAATITDAQPVSVAVAVAGASGQATPTGTVTLASGSYSAQQPLSSGAATFSIPAGTISDGANTLAANYSGDIIYATASGTTTVTVSPVVVAAPNPSPVAPGGSASATVTFSAGSTYSGTMNLTCSLTTSPTGAQGLPTCDLKPTSVTMTASGNATTTLTVNTTAASSSALNTSKPIGYWRNWGGGAIAVALMLGVPAFRRRRFVLLTLLCAVLTGGMIGCGGGGSSSPTPPPTTPATTAGSYTFTVVGTDSSNPKMTASAKVTVTVQ